MMHLPHTHRWHRVILSDRHINAYYECRCGQRTVKRGNGNQPLALEWLGGGDYPGTPMKPPPKSVRPDGAR